MTLPQYTEPRSCDEIPLCGGNLSGVIRIGDTVRRQSGPWTPAVQALLRYLEAQGFDGAPRALGVDTHGREVLTFFSGDVYSYPMPDFVWSDDTLVTVAQLLRRYHDAVQGFTPPPNAHWQVMVDAPDSGAIICHNDAGPYNTVFRDTVAVGFIDWDVAAPGPALYDVANAAWRWVPLQNAFWAPIDDQPRRLRRFCDAYGLTATERGELLPLVRRRQEVDLVTIRRWEQAGKPGWDRLWQIGHVDAIRACLTWIEENEHSLTETLLA